MADPRFARNPFVTGEPHVRFYAGVPLATSGHAIGTLCVFDSRPRPFTAAEQKILVELATWVEGEMNSSAEMARAGVGTKRRRTPARVTDLSPTLRIDESRTARPLSWCGGAGWAGRDRHRSEPIRGYRGGGGPQAGR
jgi:signal transduction protein with GAF and PtsI domain